MKLLSHPDKFSDRHLGPSSKEVNEMLEVIGVDSLDQLMDETIPAGIRSSRPLNLAPAISEFQYLRQLKEIAVKNKVFNSYIGLGYYNCITPSVIKRNILENPGWYTQYTPYQAEISQGRLEALLNFQTMVSDLTGLPIANASLLDEGTAAAEAMLMAFNYKRKKDRKSNADTILVADTCYPQTIDVLKTRANGLGIKVEVRKHQEFDINESVFAAVVQYPDADGEIHAYEEIAEKLHGQKSTMIVAADLMSLVLLESPSSWGADIVVGNSQRFGVPLGYGGPHAAYFAAKDDFIRLMPGRIIGVSKDAHGELAYRMTLQTREQHIKRDKATSNICTAQALLAIMAGMYAVYHGPDRMHDIAMRIHNMASILNDGLKNLGIAQSNRAFFDTLSIRLQNEAQIERLKSFALANQVNLFYGDDNTVRVSVDETTDVEEVALLLVVFARAINADSDQLNLSQIVNQLQSNLPESQKRTTEIFTHPVFNSYHSETAMMRYIKSLEQKDLSLNDAMIPLGSCTMKLNAATQLMPLSWPEFANIHPFVPSDQARGYSEFIEELGKDLCEITGFTGISFQPNSGAQGEYAGLLVIKAYHEARGDAHRNITLVPSSAHGTNPASAVMAGMKVVVVKCDDSGNIDMPDLQDKIEKHREELGAIMITYPSTHGVFEETVKEICDRIHEAGGMVYMDGANMNAQVGLTSPGLIGADVCHLNLHKTFSIPHGGGGPGMGPIAVNDKLLPFLPGHVLNETQPDTAIGAVAAAPFGSPSILLISYAYIKMLGKEGVKHATEYAILNANYLKSKLESHFDILYTAENGRVAHEFIVDLRQFKREAGLEVDDITKRLIDFGFHAPTVSWPVPGTIMIEPTESEPKSELDRFCNALIKIREEIEAITNGEMDREDNVLKNAPHTMGVLVSDNWDHAYNRESAAYPVPGLRQQKFWPAVSRVDNTYGDRNIMCVCPPIESYMDEEVAIN